MPGVSRRRDRPSLTCPTLPAADPAGSPRLHSSGWAAGYRSCSCESPETFSRSRRHLTIQTMFLYPRAAFRAWVNRLKGKVGRIEIVLPGDPDQREQGVAPGIGQRGAHPMGAAVSAGQTGQSEDTHSSPIAAPSCTIVYSAAIRRWFIRDLLHQSAQSCTTVHVAEHSRSEVECGSAGQRLAHAESTESKFTMSRAIHRLTVLQVNKAARKGLTLCDGGGLYSGRLILDFPLHPAGPGRWMGLGPPSGRSARCA